MLNKQAWKENLPAWSRLGRNGNLCKHLLYEHRSAVLITSSNRRRRSESRMFHPAAFTCGLLLLINICSLSSSAKNTSKNTSDIPTDYEWGSIEEIDTSGEDKLEQILKAEIPKHTF